MEVYYVSKGIGVDATIVAAGGSVYPRVILVLAYKPGRPRAGMWI
jgi:hypothetical protein